jgi:hypothetical protein
VAITEAEILLTVRTTDGRMIQVLMHTAPGEAEKTFDYIVVCHAEGKPIKIDLRLPASPAAIEVAPWQD